MPSFEADIDFEIYCSKCGTGICGNGETSKSYNGKLRLDIEPCDRCIENAMDITESNTIRDYEKKIEELEEKIYNLENKD